MSAISVNSWTAAPGKMAEAQALIKDAMQIMTGYGAKTTVAITVRGGVQGTLTTMSEYADAAAYGASIDRSAADPDWQKFMARAQQSQALVPVRSADYVEIPGLETPHSEIASHTAIRATLFTIRDGMHAKSLDRIQRSKAITERHGAKVRALQAVASAPFGLYAVVVYNRNFTEAGKSQAALATDPQWQAYVAEILGDNASADFLRSTLLRVI
jgi:hypothetical protein